MKWHYPNTALFVFLTGLVLAGAKIIYLFFGVYHILNVLIFFGVGYLFGKKVAGGRWFWGIVLALPSMFLDSYFIYRLGWSNLLEGVGISYLISFFVVPISACLGIRSQTIT